MPPSCIPGKAVFDLLKILYVTNEKCSTKGGAMTNLYIEAINQMFLIFLEFAIPHNMCNFFPQ